MKRRIAVKSASALLALSMVSVSSVGLLNIGSLNNVAIATESTVKIDEMGLVAKGEGYELSLEDFKKLTSYSGNHEDLKGFGLEKVTVKEVAINETGGTLDEIKTNAVDKGKKLALLVEKTDGTKEVFIILSNTTKGEKAARIASLKSHDDTQDYVVSKVSAKIGNEDAEGEYPSLAKITIGKDVQPIENSYTIDVNIGLKIEGTEEIDNKANKIVVSGNKEVSIKFPEKEPEPVQEQKVYKVPVKVLKADSDEVPKGASSIYKDAIVVEKGGKSQIYIQTLPQEGTDSLAFILKMYSYATDANSEKTEASIQQTKKYVEYEDYEANESKNDSEKKDLKDIGGKVKPSMFLIKRDAVDEKQILIGLESDVKDVFESPVRLILDYGNKKEGKEDDIPKNISEIEVLKKKKTTPPDKKTSTTPDTKAPTKTTPATTTSTNGKKLPQTGGPIDTIVLIALGTIAVVTGIFFYKKK